MRRSVVFGIIIAVGNFFINSTNADCNVCQHEGKTACISKTAFQQCKDNKPFGNIYECNSDEYCSILGGCTDQIDLADCDGCHKCDESKTFACIDTRRFALCIGEDTPSGIQAQCTGNLVCNVNYQQICVESLPTCSYADDTTEAPSTTPSTTSTTTTTTISPLNNPSGFCGANGKEGRFPVGTDPNTTCHQFVHCLLINGVWYGPIYNCPGSTYYDTAKRGCVAEVPSTCTSAVTRLSFRNILLE